VLSPPIAYPYLVGVYYGDGCIAKYHPKDKRCPGAKYVRLVFILQTKDKDFAETVNGQIFRMFKKRYKIYRRKTGYYWLQTGSNRIACALYGFKLEWLDRLGIDWRISFLMGMFDSEGYVYLNRTQRWQYVRVGLGITSRDLFERIKRYLAELGVMFSESIYNREGYKPLFKLMFQNKDSVRIFTQRIGFRILRKQKILDDWLNEVWR
jgi:intein-encoded DNA endonuclease-like protein